MEVAVYRSPSGTLLIVPALMQPTLDALERFGDLARGEVFETRDRSDALDLRAMIEQGYLQVTAEQLEQLRSQKP